MDGASATDREAFVAGTLRVPSVTARGACLLRPGVVEWASAPDPTRPLRPGQSHAFNTAAALLVRVLRRACQLLGPGADQEAQHPGHTQRRRRLGRVWIPG